MGLHWGAPVLESLLDSSLWAQIQSVHVDPSTPIKDIDNLSFLNGATGEKMGSLAVAHWHRLRRSKLRSLMATGITINYDKYLTNISYTSSTVTASFEDGTTATGRILIGADGARSTVRRLIAGPDTAQITRLPYAATFVQARYTRSQALFLRSFHPLYLSAPHPSGQFSFFGLQEAADPEAPETWTFFFYISWASSIEMQDKEMVSFSQKDRLKQLQALAAEYTEPWRSAAKWLPPDQPCFYLGLTVWDPSLPEHGWSNHGGKVTLAGDAAHPMTYRMSFSLEWLPLVVISLLMNSQSAAKASTTPSLTAASYSRPSSYSCLVKSHRKLRSMHMKRS
jgi:2-polyprenyl-6-methoxyphenol hydroxylase-like FAD-dependent oxidoreductase